MSLFRGDQIIKDIPPSVSEPRVNLGETEFPQGGFADQKCQIPLG